MKNFEVLKQFVDGKIFLDWGNYEIRCFNNGDFIEYPHESGYLMEDTIAYRTIITDKNGKDREVYLGAPDLNFLSIKRIVERLTPEQIKNLERVEK